MGIEKEINGYILEICTNSLTSALSAQSGGASRVELCQNLELGGTTPSYSQIKLVRQALHIGVHVLIRPRAGNFLYNEYEIEEIKQDILFCKQVGCDGVVLGALTADGQVDMDVMKEFVEIARPMQVVFHRAFDVCQDPIRALDDIISLGCDRILTSGQRQHAVLGLELIKALNERAEGRIEIMPGSGVDESNVAGIINQTGSKSIHSSAKYVESSAMKYVNTHVRGMDEDVWYTSLSKVDLLVEKLKSL